MLYSMAIQFYPDGISDSIHKPPTGENLKGATATAMACLQMGYPIAATRIAAF
jgi:hypothetical protein